ncbi:ABC transporter permease [Beduini massiliensis]|uniref:ABC transporter permease n=1 Tax=Beduini massiliensis TaxID=1585974 RepID=UPI00059AA7F6|nr:FtsX-like permease family protein [Beduini massiliensis]
MYALTYATHNLLRNKGRNILLGIILTAMITLSGITWIVYHGSSQLTQVYKQQFGSKVILNAALNAPKLSPSQLMAFGTSEYLLKQDLTAKVPIIQENLKAVGEEESTSLENIPKGYLISFSDQELNDTFKNKSKKLVQGRMFENSKEIIVSQKFAELNHLKLNDTIYLKGKKTDSPASTTFTVVGIYTPLALGQYSGDVPLLDPQNHIYTSFQTILQSELFHQYGDLSAVFYLKDPQMIAVFQEEMRTKGLPESYEATTDDRNYEEAVQPLRTTNKISLLFTAGILSLGSIITLLLSLFFMRERKYEIGLLRAMGMKKLKVAISLMTENVWICCISLSIGLAFAQVGGHWIGQIFLQNQQRFIEKMQLSVDLSQITFHMDITGMVLLIGTISCLCFLSGLVAIWKIMRYEPRQILSQQN